MFYPGAAGVQFLNQYAQAGLKGTIPLYTAFIDRLARRCRAQKDAALGVIGALAWTADLPNDANKKFVADFKASSRPSRRSTRAQSYDAANLIASAVAAVKGNLERQGGGAEGAGKGATSSRCAATSSSAPTTIRSRTSTCRKW